MNVTRCNMLSQTISDRKMDLQFLKKNGQARGRHNDKICDNEPEISF